MNFHLTKYRPKVKMSNNKESKSHELSSYKILGQQMLQKRLAGQYCIKGTTEVEMPAECQVYINEGKILIANKQKRDKIVRRNRNDMVDACKKGAMS